MVEFKKTARTKGEWVWIHDGSPVYTVTADLKTWTKQMYDGDAAVPTVIPAGAEIWNPFDDQRGIKAGGVLSFLAGAVTTTGAEHYIQGTLDGAAATNVMHFKHGRAQEGKWQQEATDDSFVDFSVAAVGCWVSEQVTLVNDASANEISFKNVDLQGRYPRTGFLSLEGLETTTLAKGMKIGKMEVFEDSTEDDDIKVLLEPEATAGIKVTVQYGSSAKLKSWLGIPTASAFSHLNVVAYPRDDSDDGFGTGVPYSTTAIPALDTTAVNGLFEIEYTAAYSAALTEGTEYEIRLRGASATAAGNDVGNEVAVAIATSGDGNPDITRVFNVTHGTKVFGVKWAVTAQDDSALVAGDANMTFRAIVFG